MIMPAHALLSDGRLLVAVRCQAKGAGGESRNWIDLYRSSDEGQSWAYLTRPVPDTGRGGNPPTLTRLQDGRLCLTSGYRDPPYRMEARFSSDDGQTWSAPRTLNRGAGNHDIGYPRTVQRPDGQMVTAYYWNDAPEGERYIVATIWDPAADAG
jgi:hypothetical protein